ncbi:type II CRISPR RNA-guided endonuclease Cas9 [Demequina sediminicola]|uniref:type II CRISPR RNA-guided endonuclease Cas9 n=1 Tax=Demequina sediminicola TaxID=1095026 RepID=UPI0007862B22|nr:type II CRISPR RNA-guided endonuclease Cas9 [Demequina sediminicola]
MTGTDATAHSHTPYRLGLDVGTGSLGWAVVELDTDGNPVRIVRTGSRIYGSGRKPKDFSSLAADRRAARQMRKQRDRYLQRRTRLMHELVAAGLMPEAEVERQKLKDLNPYLLRARGVKEELTAHELGRALFHLQQRRGFKSNRKTDRKDDDRSAMKSAIASLQSDLGDDTLGTYMWKRIQNGESVRSRPRKVGSKNEYDFYVNRAMVEDEFNQLWDYQSQSHGDLLTDEARIRVHDAIFSQRPLKPVDPGRCTFETDQRRAPKALPSSQLFRIYQELNAIRVIDPFSSDQADRPLTRQERDAGASFLLGRVKATFPQLKKAMFGPTKLQLSLEYGERKNILGDVVGSELRKAQHIGPDWETYDLATQDLIVTILLEADTDDEVIERLQAESSLSLDQVHGALEAPLPDDYLRLSHRAIGKILPHLKDEWNEEGNAPVMYDAAVRAAGYQSHSEFHSGVLEDTLPYYGKVLKRYTQEVSGSSQAATNPDEWEFGKIANPTVHIGLNQIRTVVNSLIDRYGLPTQIHVEVARDLGQSAEGRREAASNRAKNERANEALNARLTELGQRTNFANRERLRLYDEISVLNHRCVLTGIPIEMSRLFTNDYQVDHILPFSRTLDDSRGNKILVHHTANQFKGARSPFEAYSETADWDHILQRASDAFGATSPKFKRFSADAMDRYSNGEQDFIARQLNDTSYLARVTREYLGSIVDPDRILATPGRLTSLLRHHWGLNGLLSDAAEKNRSDHRHHAIDALVVALSERVTLKAVTDANRRAGDQGIERLLVDLPQPWEGFADHARESVDRIVVSHKPDHNEKGQLHEETAYGVLEGPDKKGRFLTRKRITDPAKGVVGSWEQPKWRDVIPLYRRGEGPDSTLPYKAYIGGSNYCIEIVRTAKGKWAGEVVSTHTANTAEYRAFMAEPGAYRAQSYAGGDLVMRLIANDTIAIEVGDAGRQIMRLCQLETVGAMYFANVREGNVAARSRARDNDFSLLKKAASTLQPLKARRVFVDPIGRVFDPDFKE